MRIYFVSFLLFPFENKAIELSRGATEKVKNKAYGIDEIPDARVDLEPTLVNRMAFSLSIKSLKHTEYHILWNMLEDKGVIPADYIFVFLYADDSVKHVFTRRVTVKYDVVFFTLALTLFDDDHIATGTKKRLHARTPCRTGAIAVGIKLL